jgi:hypothetical protein
LSWDVALCIDTGNGLAEVVDIGNYTYNVSKMYSAAGIIFSDLEGMNAGEASEYLIAGINEMKQDPDKFRGLNPPNGWGEYSSALKFLEEIAKACKKHPACTVKIY